MTADKLMQPPRLGNFKVNVVCPISLTEDQNAGMMRAVHRCLIHNTLLSPPEILIELTRAKRPSNMPERMIVKAPSGGPRRLPSCAMQRCSNRSMASLDNFRLVVFRTVAEQHSFRKAAEELYLTQPAVSLQIKALEEDIGVQLFDRTGAHIALTEAGKVLLDILDRRMPCSPRLNTTLPR